MRRLQYPAGAPRTRHGTASLRLPDARIAPGPAKATALAGELAMQEGTNEGPGIGKGQGGDDMSVACEVYVFLRDDACSSVGGILHPCLWLRLPAMIASIATKVGPLEFVVTLSSSLLRPRTMPFCTRASLSPLCTPYSYPANPCHPQRRSHTRALQGVHCCRLLLPLHGAGFFFARHAERIASQLRPARTTQLQPILWRRLSAPAKCAMPW